MAQTRISPPMRRPFALGAVVFIVSLGLLILHAHTTEAQERPRRGASEKAPANFGSAEHPKRAITGVILDGDDNPIPDALLVAGLDGTGTSNHTVFTTDREGRFSWPIPAGAISVVLYAHKPGYRPIAWPRWLEAKSKGDEIELRLHKVKSDPFVATVVDGEDTPIAGARVRVEMRASVQESNPVGGAAGVNSFSIGFFYWRREILDGSPLERLFVTATDEHGAFVLGAFGPNDWLRLSVTTRDGRALRIKTQPSAGGLTRRIMAEQGFVSAPTGKTTQLVALPAARIRGRVVTKLPDVSVRRLRVWYQSSRAIPERSVYSSNFGAVTLTDDDGRFTFDDLNEGTVNVFVGDDDSEHPWTYRAAQDVELKSGWTKAVMIQLIRGVEVEGTALSRDTREPLQGANIGVYGPFRPHSGAATLGAKTDAQGRYRYRLPPGETYFYIMGNSPGHGDRTVVIPEGVAHFKVPPLVP
jgi:hypothetical protein